MEYIKLARILKPHGLKGEVKCFSMTDFPKQRFQPRTKLSLLNEKTGERKDAVVKSYHMSGNDLFLKFEGIEDMDAAETLRNFTVEIDKESAPMPKGYIRYADLIGCDVYDQNEALIGKVVDVTLYAPTPNLKIEREGGKPFYVPFVKNFVISEDIEAKKVVIEVVEGML
ncbi:MAG: ribosome maturation factor RimM [Bacilli bacterium]|nr:ribosome maturation factor RimM [Bacilli bacterium]